jgi:hypothetical protein
MPPFDKLPGRSFCKVMVGADEECGYGDPNKSLGVTLRPEGDEPLFIFQKLHEASTLEKKLHMSHEETDYRSRHHEAERHDNRLERVTPCTSLAVI